jgi:hypothetical protein
MSVVREPEVSWSPEQMVEIALNEPDDFLKVRETLTRIGVASRKEKKIYQSCHILHKQGRYFLVHFKELFALDGKHANQTQKDIKHKVTKTGSEQEQSNSERVVSHGWSPASH